METPLTPLDFARRARKIYSEREAVVDGDFRVNYGQFFERCDRWSSTLQQLGIQPGDRVAYIAPNTHAQLESFYSVPQIGAVLVPVNYRLSSSDFAYILRHSGARMVCVHSKYLEDVDSVRGEVGNVEYFVSLEGERSGWLSYENLLASSSTAFRKGPVSEGDVLTINYTSGTTARPKGVMITHRNAYVNVVGTLVHFAMTPVDRYLWTLPMFHANGWTFVWTATAVGATHICLRDTAPANILETIEREAVTVLCAAPTVLIGIANAALTVQMDSRRGVRILSAGAPPAAATIERIEHKLGWEITHVYGLTETSPFISICEPKPEHRQLPLKEKAVIKARQGVELVTSGELRVIDDDGRDVPHDGEKIGEIVARGNSVMLGYYLDPEATSQAFRGGWFHTGDAAIVHPDGYIEIRDRFKDIIISGGENISSVEVEGILLHHPAVLEVAVVGIPHERWGETPQAFVVLKPGATLTQTQLLEFARANMAHFKMPQGVTFLSELPKTATGKIQKYVLRGNRPAVPSS